MNYTHKVIRLKDGANCGDHTSEKLADKRIGRLVAMSNEKLTRADFKVEPIEHTEQKQ